MTKEVKEDIQKAVSIIRKCFKEVQAQQVIQSEKNTKLRLCKVNDNTIVRKETTTIWNRWRHLLTNLKTRR